MTYDVRLLMLLGILFTCFLQTAPAQAQATRTWISGVGDDANPCSRTAPCKTFAGAISKTATGGEIDALDPGGFGALTITKPITLDGGGLSRPLSTGTWDCRCGGLHSPSTNLVQQDQLRPRRRVVLVRFLTAGGKLRNLWLYAERYPHRPLHRNQPRGYQS